MAYKKTDNLNYMRNSLEFLSLYQLISSICGILAGVCVVCLKLVYNKSDDYLLWIPLIIETSLFSLTVFTLYANKECTKSKEKKFR